MIVKLAALQGRRIFEAHVEAADQEVAHVAGDRIDALQQGGRRRGAAVAVAAAHARRRDGGQAHGFSGGRHPRGIVAHWWPALRMDRLQARIGGQHCARLSRPLPVTAGKSRSRMPMSRPLASSGARM
jgi:hypothetical protein